MSRRPTWICALGLLAVVACADDNPPRFEHGVASGDPLRDGVIIWTRVTPGDDANRIDVTWQVAADAAFADVVAEGRAAAVADADFTVKVDVTGLSAGRTYFYDFSADGARSPAGRTKTLPAGSPESVRFAVVSCSSYPTGLFNVYRQIANRSEGDDDLDAVLHLGDYFYEYGPNGFGDADLPDRLPEPPSETITVDDYRARHGQYKRDPDLQAMHATHPMIAVWDDHESANNAWLGGAENHDDSEGSWDARRSAAVQAYYEWMPIREPAAGGSVFRQFQFGDLVTLTMLDTRLAGRSEQLDYANYDLAEQTSVDAFLDDYLDPARTMLGAEQEQWLEANLAGPRNTVWDVIGQQVMVGQLYVPTIPNLDGLTDNPLVGPLTAVATLGSTLAEQGRVPGLGLGFGLDAWDGYVPARKRLFDLLAPLPNVVVVTGDFHNAFAIDLVPDDVLAAGWARGQAGPVAAEFVTSSVTSPGLESQIEDDLVDLVQLALQLKNPHIRYSDLRQRGYLVVEFTPAEASGQFFFTNTIRAPVTQDIAGPRYRLTAGQKGLIAP